MTRDYRQLLLDRHRLAVDILQHVDHACKELGFSFMMIGAQARDLIMIGKYGLKPGSTTLDTDLAVAVDSWDEYQSLRDALRHVGFSSVKAWKQKLSYGDDYTIDLIPFGNIERDGKILWPPDGDPEMLVIGYREVFAHSELLAIGGDMSIRVASLAGIAVLKITAWKDRNDVTWKDGEDLALILKNYIDAGNVDRIYSSEGSDILRNVGFDYELASACLLGRDVSSMVNDETRNQLCSIVDDELTADSESLIRAMMPCFSRNYEFARNMLEAFRSALQEETGA